MHFDAKKAIDFTLQYWVVMNRKSNILVAMGEGVKSEKKIKVIFLFFSTFDDIDHPGTCWVDLDLVGFPLYLYFKYRLPIIPPITVCHLSSSEPHGFRPYVVSPDKDINLESVHQIWRLLQLS